jgi:membrane-bound lytic murein transglycosylase MltF
LPVSFFTNLIWRESRFDHEAISRAGAMGIAQFMPDVADRLKLDAFDARGALAASGRLLRELLGRFNNLGLVAAAYNAGPKRVFDWLRQKAPLPKETRDYVSIITGQPVEKWVGPKKAVVFDVPRQVPCHRSAQFAAIAGAERADQLRRVAEEEKAARLEKERKEREAAAARATAAKNAKKKGKHAIATASSAKSAPHAGSHAASSSTTMRPASLRNTDKRLFIKRNSRSA